VQQERKTEKQEVIVTHSRKERNNMLRKLHA